MRTRVTISEIGLLKDDESGNDKFISLYHFKEWANSLKGGESNDC